MAKKLLIIATLLVSVAIATAQTRGVIECQDSPGVLALEGPGSLVVVKALSCGQQVTIVGADKGYVKLQITESLAGYVEAKSVRSVQTFVQTDRRNPDREKFTMPSAGSPGIVTERGRADSDRRIADSEAGVKEFQDYKASKMTYPERETRRLTSRREDRGNGWSGVELFGGYSYLNADMNGLDSRQSVHGWNASVSTNVNPWFAAEFDVAGYYKTVSGILYQAYSYAAGPRVNFRPVFVHALFGGDRSSFGSSGISVSQNSFAGMLGGGVQVPLTHGLAFRGSVDYVFSRHNIFKVLNPSLPSVTQNNIRASAGIVILLGGRERKR
jgi:hypothetical protein